MDIADLNADDLKRLTPQHSPTGKEAVGYGEVRVRVWLTGTEADPSAEAVVEAPPGMPLLFFIVATEHLMTATALKCSNFEEALGLLAEGARSNKGKKL